MYLLMNWYKIFYWITVADGVKKFFDAFSNIFMTLSILLIIALFFMCIGYGSAKENHESEDSLKEYRFWITSTRRVFVWCMIFTVVTWAGYIFCPTKKDAMIIVAGGAIGNFITSDSSSKQIPAELTLLVREKMREEIRDLKVNNVADTLQSKTKEELIQLIKNK